MLRKMMFYALSASASLPGKRRIVNISFDDQDRGVVVPLWNNWIKGESDNLDLKDNKGDTTGFRLSYLSEMAGTYAEYQGFQTDPDGVFPPEVLQQMLNRGSDRISMRFTGLNGGKMYKMTFVAVQSYNDPGDATTVFANGLSVDLEGPSAANVVYKKSLEIVNPPGGIIDLAFGPTISSGYACINAMIIEELN